jgi:hypothetical protein
MVSAQAKVREPRELVGFGSQVTLDACRHGGMTELGHVELAEQAVMALARHKTPRAARALREAAPSIGVCGPLYSVATSSMRTKQRQESKRRGCSESKYNKKMGERHLRVNGAPYGTATIQ